MAPLLHGCAHHHGLREQPEALEGEEEHGDQDGDLAGYPRSPGSQSERAVSSLWSSPAALSKRLTSSGNSTLNRHSSFRPPASAKASDHSLHQGVTRLET